MSTSCLFLDGIILMIQPLIRIGGPAIIQIAELQEARRRQQEMRDKILGRRSGSEAALAPLPPPVSKPPAPPTRKIISSGNGGSCIVLLPIGVSGY